MHLPDFHRVSVIKTSNCKIGCESSEEGAFAEKGARFRGKWGLGPPPTPAPRPPPPFSWGGGGGFTEKIPGGGGVFQEGGGGEGQGCVRGIWGGGEGAPRPHLP